MEFNGVPVPNELIARIFCWIHPSRVQLYRPVCRHLSHVLTSSHFASLNLSRFISPSKIGKVELVVNGSYKESGLVVEEEEWCDDFHCHCEFRVDWFQLHKSHQEVYFNKYLAHSAKDDGILGQVPVQLGRLDLTHLNLAENRLVGCIPVELGMLLNLVRLELNANNLGGVIPSELGNLSQLRVLNLSKNNLKGCIPSELGKLNNLVRLNLSMNELTGALDLCGLSNLEVLNVAENNLSGALPSNLGQLKKLKRLWLQMNKFSGSIPPSFGDLDELDSLWLNNNKLSMSIPADLGNMAKLQTLSLSNNSLSGRIPPELCNLTKLSGLYLNGNQLTGSIPMELSDLPLRFLDLRRNKLDPFPIHMRDQIERNGGFIH
ncbi:L domain-like protein [Rhizoclosmatium globosum]|uniref:L domain-like protein n=1 Tax=Rhizoclosmatium globosum TaxID=329046 RepID=A0A1Y2BUV2_9FUNG|nr:L domain-like protein [Rhizoclosmatium globosum]|eukprot:ORY38526.1 L domain-like protein [Rhizoclosmatium globosum]